jgi:hypothetical protein
MKNGTGSIYILEQTYVSIVTNFLSAKRESFWEKY